MKKTKRKAKKEISSGKKKEGKMKAQDTKKISPVVPEGAENIDKIRDILFGSQVRDFEKRFARLEEFVKREIRSLETGTTQRFDSLENYIRSEIESLSKQLNTEQKERSNSVEDLSSSLKETKKTIDKKTALLDQQMTKGQGDLRQQLLDRSKKITDEMRNKYKEITAVLERSVKELQTDKTDRLALADLFMEVSLRLKEEFKIPAGGK